MRSVRTSRTGAQALQVDQRLRDENANDSLHVLGQMGEQYYETWKIALKIEYPCAEWQTILISYPVHVVVGEMDRGGQ